MLADEHDEVLVKTAIAVGYANAMFMHDLIDAKELQNLAFCKGAAQKKNEDQNDDSDEEDDTDDEDDEDDDKNKKDDKKQSKNLAALLAQAAKTNLSK